ncbi:MAG TPA: Lrp/AsnC family transcriptional regulator [Chloroflexi bacterium]|jgi:Lrp/AsnC family transcriptional regulator for asnA, asnC and gidA|nr:Lrp/AsnC family transcriptional regulator [Chloroflexota bacterium]HPO59667.1 Lrp/AsnC family transcriptional regulator [Anaerolineaceae bacterium]
MKLKLDRLDKKIVDLLAEDGRMPSKEIAEKIEGATERMVRYRIKRLLDAGVISISARVNPQAIGFPVIADIFIEVEPGQIMELAHRVAEYDNVTYVACSTGERDVSIQVVAHDYREIYAFVTNVIAALPGVRRTSTSFVPMIIKDDSQWSLPESVILPDGR